MGKYEELVIQHEEIPIYENDLLPDFQSGCFFDGEIYIKKSLNDLRKLEILHEEIAHYKITAGDILDYKKPINRYFENKARRLANHSAITFDDLIEANQSGVRNLHELSEFLELNEDYVSKVLDEYFSIYGLDVIHRNYLIRFSPLSVTKLSEI